jgi:2,3-bisphosphoglycerate-independent phosphoglycerate mutase
MKAAEVTDALLREIAAGSFRFGRVNLANGDMVGHTGVRQAAILAVETVDLCLARIRRGVRAAEGILVVTADHGNSDEMFEWDRKAKRFQRDAEGRFRPKTAHTLNPVAFVVEDFRVPPGPPPERLEPFGTAGRAPATTAGLDWELDPAVAAPGLAHVASTVLFLLGYAPPALYEPPLVRPRAV